MSRRLVVTALALALGIGASVPALLAPARAAAPPQPKRIYIANDDHTDYYWTGTDSDYRAAFLSMLDYYLTQADSTASNPHDAQSRFNCDGSVWVWEYEHNKPPADFDRLVSRIRDGTITVPLNTCVELHGAMPAEAVLRNMYYAGRLERRYDLRFPLVLSMENQTLPGGIASLWAGAGARYSWKGICNCATRIDATNRSPEIYEFAGPDGQSVYMKWNSFQDYEKLGTYGEAAHPQDIVAYLDSDPGFLARWPWSVSAAFGHGLDTLATRTTAFVDASLALSNDARRVIVSDEVDFFDDFVGSYGDSLPTVSGCSGNEWDLYSASMGELTADFKREVEKLRTAEALATVVSLQDPTFMAGRETARDSAFLACGLYYEHDWTNDGPKSAGRAAWQRRIHDALAGYVDALYGDGLTRLGGLVAANGAERYAVFNPLSWPRTDVVDLPASPAAPWHVVDVATGQEVPSQAVIVDGVSRLRILASAVPSVGYRVYEVVAGAGAAFPASATIALPAIDNGIYRVTLGKHGQITSLIQHAAGDREWVRAGSSLLDLGTGNTSATLESSGPVSTTVRVLTTVTPHHETHVTLYAGLDRVDVDDRITNNFSTNLAYASTAALTAPTLHHEEVGMIARIGRHGDGGDYADRNTRTDWLTFAHFLDLTEAGHGLTVSNWDSPFVHIGASTPTTLDATSPTFAACIGMQVDGSGLGIPNEGGDRFFRNRYALRAHDAYDPAAAMRFALEHQNPLVATAATAAGAGALPADSWSLLSIDDPNVLLWALKPAEEGIGAGVIARVWNVADGPRPLTLTFTPGIRAAVHTTHIETDLAPAVQDGQRLTDDLARQQLRTYRLYPGSAATAGVGALATGPRLAVAPNPTMRRSVVAFALSRPGSVRVVVHDLRGRRIAVLVDGPLAAGHHEVMWDGRDSHGALAPPGIYFVALDGAGPRTSARIVVVR